jgi:ribosomal-protein-alanine N-acetyltransferase
MAQPNDFAVALRPLQRSDAEAITRLLENDAEGISWTGRIPFPFTLSDAHAFLDRVLAGPAPMAIEVNGQFAGGIGVADAESEAGAGELGYWVGKPFRGCGVARRAIGLMLERGRTMGYQRIVAHVFPGNDPSIRLLEAYGFRQTHLSDENIPLRGGLRRIIHFCLDVE